MQVKFDIPDDVAASLTAGGRDLSRAALEAMAIEGYRTGSLSEWQIVQMLGFEIRVQVHQFLKDHDVPLNYTYTDFLQDCQAARRNADPGLRSDDPPQRLAG